MGRQPILGYMGSRDYLLLFLYFDVLRINLFTYLLHHPRFLECIGVPDSAQLYWAVPRLNVSKR